MKYKLMSEIDWNKIKAIKNTENERYINML
jgi:hypothetical protein